MSGSPLIEDDRRLSSFDGGARAQDAVASRLGEFPEFTDLVFASRHRLFRTVVTGVILSVMLAGLAWSLTKPRYTAEGLVRVREQQDVVYAAQTSRAADTAFFYSQEKLALSPQVLSAALEQEEVKALSGEIPENNAVAWLRQMMRVDTQSGSEVMSIAVVHSSPRLAHALANAVTKSYLAEITSRLTRDRQRRERELERAAREAEKKADQLWQELNSLAQSIGSDSSQSLTIRDELQLQAYRDYTRQLQTAQLRGNELQAQLEEQKLRMQQELSGVDEVSDSLLEKHEAVVIARERVLNIDLQIQQMRKIAASQDSPRLQRLYADREFYQSELDRIVNQLRPQLQKESLEQSQRAMEDSLAQIKKQIELNRAEKEFLRTRLSEIDTGILRPEGKSGVRLDMSRHAVDRQMRLADSLWQSLQELKIESQSQPRVTLIELPQIPRQANHSRQLKAAGAAGLIGWMIAILGIGYSEWRDCRVRSPKDVADHSALPVFGAECSSGTGLFGFERQQASSAAREAAAKMMLKAGDGGMIPTLMLSSSAMSEPRHLVSLELAQAFCRFRRRTLLIDCDSSGSHLSRSLGVGKLPGMRQVSSASIDPRPYLIPAQQEQIDFLPIGPRNDDESWIDPESLHQVIQSLRQEYDAVVVNGPAVVSNAESLLLASQVDFLLLAVFTNTSRWDQLALSERSAIQAGIPVAGSILHRGKRSSKWKLDVDRRGGASPLAQDDIAAEDLRRQVEEIQNDVRQVKEDPNAAPKNTRPNPESST